MLHVAAQDPEEEWILCCHMKPPPLPAPRGSRQGRRRINVLSFSQEKYVNLKVSMKVAKQNRKLRQCHNQKKRGRRLAAKKTKCNKQKNKMSAGQTALLESVTTWQQSEVWASVLWSTWLVRIDDRCALAAAWKRLTSSSSSSCLTSWRADRRRGKKTYQGKTTHIAHKSPLCSSFYTCCLPAPTSVSFHWYIHCRTSRHVCTISVWLVCPYLQRPPSDALGNLFTHCCTVKSLILFACDCWDLYTEKSSMWKKSLLLQWLWINNHICC